MDWNDVRFFLALARQGSVRAAGAELGVSHSTVARRVEALEAQLGVRLFDRDRDGYALTDAGHEMVPGAERVESEMAALERGLVGRDARLAGPVSVTCCDQYVSAMLLEQLRGFSDRCPEIELVMSNDSRSFDLSKREADIAVRVLGRDARAPEHLIGSRVVPLVCASYVAIAHARDCDPEQQGKRRRWLGTPSHKVTRELVAQSSYPDLPIWGELSSLVLLVQAARAGFGIVMLPCYVGDADPALRRLAEPDLRHVADVWLLSHPDLRDNARLKAARGCVAEALKKRQPLFAGDIPRAAAQGRDAAS